MRLLLINPRFNESFWSFRWTLEEILPNKRAVNPPLGLATLAALCPPHWTVEIVDENIETVPLAPRADVVGVCGMAAQFERQAELLAAAPEQERVAAFQPHHALPGAREVDEQLVDFSLRSRVAVAALADVDQLRVAARELEDALADEMVVDDGVRVLQQPQRSQRQQLRIARPCAHEVNDAASRRVAACPVAPRGGCRLSPCPFVPEFHQAIAPPDGPPATAWQLKWESSEGPFPPP